MMSNIIIVIFNYKLFLWFISRRYFIILYYFYHSITLFSNNLLLLLKNLENFLKLQKNSENLKYRIFFK